MITKGIILERIIGTNTYYVRIPYLETSGVDVSRLVATVSDNPAISEEYKVDDVVYISFEEHQANKPVIIGKLYVEGSGHRGSANFESLSVSTKVNLPKDTTICGKDLSQLLNKVENNPISGSDIKHVYRHAITVTCIDNSVIKLIVICSIGSDFTIANLLKTFNLTGIPLESGNILIGSTSKIYYVTGCSVFYRFGDENNISVSYIDSDNTSQIITLKMSEVSDSVIDLNI